MQSTGIPNIHSVVSFSVPSMNNVAPLVKFHSNSSFERMELLGPAWLDSRSNEFKGHSESSTLEVQPPSFRSTPGSLEI